VGDLTNHPATPAPEGVEVPSSAGAVLRAAREAAGLTIDDVAQQLKLAPRQVHALETDDFARLPGRTFVRGFVRNYARYVGLQTDDVVALLPGADVAPSLERPTITPAGRPMGLLPADSPTRRSWTWWAIPLALLAIVVAAGWYELRRPQDDLRRLAPDKEASPPPVVRPQASSSGTTSALLPNPLGDGTGAAAAPTAAASNPAAGGAVTSSASVPAPAGVPVPGGTAAAEPAATGAAASGATDNQLVVTFKGTSWVQVRDRNGNVVLAQNGQPGTVQAVSGAPPLDIVIGNAAQVAVTFRGQPVDLAPHVRGDVARLSVR
jgi:cytoskeleton protein RodZ